MYGCESWTVKKAEHQGNDAFELWCLRRLLRVPWTARRSNQSILKEISPGISLEGMMLKLKLQYFGYLMRRVDSLEKTLMLGGAEGTRRRDDRLWDGRMPSPTRWTWVWVISRSWWWTGRPDMLRFMGSQRVGHNWETELNWTEWKLKKIINYQRVISMTSIWWTYFTIINIEGTKQSTPNTTLKLAPGGQGFLSVVHGLTTSTWQAGGALKKASLCEPQTTLIYAFCYYSDWASPVPQQ